MATSTATMTSDDDAQFDDDETTTTMAAVRGQAARLSPMGAWATTTTIDDGV